MLGLTQQALAERSDCTLGTIRKTEAGRRPPQKFIERLATALQNPIVQRLQTETLYLHSVVVEQLPLTQTTEFHPLH
jgi:transcriptional regulator with XRE-family HTH domain